MKIRHYVQERVEITLDDYKDKNFVCVNESKLPFSVRRVSTSDGAKVFLSGPAIKVDNTLGLVDRSRAIKLEELTTVYKQPHLEEAIRNTWKGYRELSHG